MDEQTAAIAADVGDTTPPPSVTASLVPGELVTAMHSGKKRPVVLVRTMVTGNWLAVALIRSDPGPHTNPGDGAGAGAGAGGSPLGQVSVPTRMGLDQPSIIAPHLIHVPPAAISKHIGYADTEMVKTIIAVTGLYGEAARQLRHSVGLLPKFMPGEMVTVKVDGRPRPTLLVARTPRGLWRAVGFTTAAHHRSGTPRTPVPNPERVGLHEQSYLLDNRTSVIRPDVVDKHLGHADADLVEAVIGSIGLCGTDADALRSAVTDTPASPGGVAVVRKDTAAKKVARYENDGWSIRDTAAEAGCSDTLGPPCVGQ